MRTYCVLLGGPWNGQEAPWRFEKLTTMVFRIKHWRGYYDGGRWQEVP